MSNRCLPRPRILVSSLVMILVCLLLPAGTLGIQDAARPVMIQAAGRGNPYINFQDGREIRTSFSGGASLTSTLASSNTKGLALASADFDEDGMPDLVASYDSSKGGLLSLHFGNVDAVYPNAPEAKERRAKGTFVDAPFLPDAKLFETPERPDFIGAGDFDADGHWDLVAARQGGQALALHRGDGTGGFYSAESLPLPGAVTALATGDVNRRDGLEDVLVGVTAPSGAQLLVFEWPEGALRGQPEVIDLPEPATDLAVGHLDGKSPVDIAVAAGKHLLIVEGRDRRLTHREDRRMKVGAARSIDYVLSMPLLRIALVDLGSDGPAEVAGLSDDGAVRLSAVAELEAFSTSPSDPIAQISPADAAGARLMVGRFSSAASSSLALMNPQGRELRIIGRPPLQGGQTGEVIFSTIESTAAALPGRLNPDGMADLICLSGETATLSSLESLPLATFAVTNINNSGAGSLRAAITSANASPGADIIQFSIPGAGPHLIQPLTVLPGMTGALTLDGTSEPDFAGTPVVWLDGVFAASPNPVGLHVFNGPTVIRGMAVSRFGTGILLESTGGNIVEGNHAGTDASGTVAAGNTDWGIQTVSGVGDLIGGTTAAARNLVSANCRGVFVLGGANHLVHGNRIGTNAAGTSALPNTCSGVLVGNASPPDTSIGGTTAGSGNLVSGNSGDGIRIGLVTGAGTLIQGNVIGTNAAGGAALPNTGAGINVGTNDVTVGGTTPAARNQIAGNALAGVGFEGGVRHVVQGNWIGLHVGGVIAIPNGLGVLAHIGDSLIGGAVPGARNVISGNTGPGVLLDDIVTGNDVLLNFIGVSPNGLFSVGNGIGVQLTSARDNRIGGASLAAANVISANSDGGILLEAGANSNLIEVNLIGTNASGNASPGLQNGLFGIRVSDSQGNLIGVKQGQGNIIGGSPIGLHIQGGGSTDNRIQGNKIGTLADGATAHPNFSGLLIDGGASNNIIGGIFAETGNLFSGNTGAGLTIAGSGATGNLVEGNLIGTDITGTVALGNVSGGVVIDSSSSNTIGGPATNDRNLISANGNNLIVQANTATPAGNVVQGNYFGTNASGTAPLGPGASNVALLSANATIFERNVVGGDHTRGLRIVGGAGNIVFGNLFGVSPSMTSIGLSGPGIRIEGSSANVIGGVNPGESNVIANNSDDAIQILGFVSANFIRGNSIDNNGGLGIDLDPNGVTPNDAGDADTGPNGLQNFPVLTSADTTGGTLTIAGTLNSTPSSSYELDFYASPSCDPSGHGEGATYLGSTTAVTNAAGNASFTASLTAAVPGGDVITATAIFNVGSTSEFSACLAAVGVPPPAPTAVEFPSPLTLTWDAVPGASLYHLYGGTDLTLFSMAAPDDDVCEVGAVPAPGVQLPEASGPPPGHMFWVVLTSEGPYGEGPPQPASGGPADFSSAGSCGDSCAHDQCEPGVPLQPACTLCASIMCDSDPSCCTTGWDASCVQKVRTVCRSLSCPESAGQCAHEACAQGGALQPGCDAPPLAVSCTAAICQIDPHCCQQGWDSACIAHLPSVCGYSCF